MRTFEHFPPEATCPICGQSTDGPCILIPIDGRIETSSICGAQPTHAACLTEHASSLRLNRSAGVMYWRIAVKPKPPNGNGGNDANHSG